MGAVIERAERAADGEKIEYGGRLVDPRYRFKTETIIELLGITEAEMRACGFRHLVSPEIRREQRREAEAQRRPGTAGVRSRAEYPRQAVWLPSAWESEGISRATWYRQRPVREVRGVVWWLCLRRTLLRG